MTKIMDGTEYLTVQEAARWAGVHHCTIRYWMLNHHLEFKLVSGRTKYYINKQALDEFLAAWWAS